MDMSTLCMRYQIVCLSRRSIFALLIVVALSACVASNGRTSDTTHAGNANVKTQNAGTTNADEREMDLVLSVENQQWKMGDAVPVKLRLHHKGKVPVLAICSFHLTDPAAGKDPFKQGRNLWAPVVIEAAGVQPARAAPGETASSLLNPGQPVEFEVDLNKLLWGKLIQSTWPNGTFSQTAEPGNYEVSFRMNVRGGETSEQIKSNAVKVALK